MTDFFVSYNRADRQWAEWIAWILEEAGYSVLIQAWDFRPGGNFVLNMQRAAAESQKTIAVLSETYLKSAYAQPEWAAAFADDPLSTKQKLLPIRVKECQPTGLLKPIVYVDLVGLSAPDAKQTVLDSLRERAKPESEPVFPGMEGAAGKLPDAKTITEPKAFPSALSRVQQIKEKSLQQRLDSLMSDYAALTKQRDFTTNAADRNALERQLTAIAQDLDNVAVELDALGK
jgi:hypothetical protein